MYSDFKILQTLLGFHSKVKQCFKWRNTRELVQFFSLNYLFLEVKVIAAADICFCCASVLINTIMDSSDPKKKRKQNRCFGQVPCSVPADVEFLSFFRIFHFTSVFGLRAISCLNYPLVFSRNIMLVTVCVFSISVITSDNKITSETRQILILIAMISNILWFIWLC